MLTEAAISSLATMDMQSLLYLNECALISIHLSDTHMCILPIERRRVIAANYPTISKLTSAWNVCLQCLPLTEFWMPSATCCRHYFQQRFISMSNDLANYIKYESLIHLSFLFATQCAGHIKPYIIKYGWQAYDTHTHTHTYKCVRC